MEDERVPPGGYGHAERAHRQDKVGAEPRDAIGEEERLQHARDVDHVAEVQHEEMEFGGLVHEVTQDEEEEHQPGEEGREPVRVSEKKYLSLRCDQAKNKSS